MANYSFSGHESFACKSLWLKKGYDFVVRYRFFAISIRCTNIYTQTYRLLEKDKKKSSELEEKINRILSDNNNVDVCTLLSLLTKKMKGDSK